jgi:signal transduction histidine kinase
MIGFSSILRIFRSCFPFFSRSKETTNAPILKLCRIYSVLAAGAAMLILICFCLNSWLWNEMKTVNAAELLRKEMSGSISLNRFNLILNWLGLGMLAGAIFYGFKIVREAGRETRRNAQFLQEAKQRTMEIAALYDTSQDVSVQHDLSALLQTIVERAKKLLATAGCAIFLYDSEHDDFQIMVEVGVGMPIGTHLSRHEGLAGHVADTCEPMIVNDYSSWPHRSKALKQLPISAALCVPMVRAGKLIGVLGVHEVGSTHRTFTDAEARLLTLFGDNAAGAIYNARLMDALRNSEERFRIAAECASDSVYDWDLAADQTDYFGGMFEKTLAKKNISAGSRRAYWELIHPDDRLRVQEALKKHFENGSSFSEEYRISDGKGASMVVVDRATAIRDKNGKPVRLIGAVSDITERKHAEQMKTDFVSFVTHQLRTPLSGVKWMLELAEESLDDPEELRSFIRDARVSTDRLIGLVNDLLDISRLERGGLKMVCESIDLAYVTDSVINEINPLLLEKKHKLSVQADDDLPKVYADAQLIRQVILNLVSNAVKYTPSRGEILIQIAREDGRIRWIVRDNGIGIPHPDLEKLFEKFGSSAEFVGINPGGSNGLWKCGKAPPKSSRTFPHSHRPY